MKKHTKHRRVANFWGFPEIVKEKFRKQNKGKVPWNKGLTGKDVFSKQAIEKISAPQRGKPRFYLRGDKNHNWKGGVTPIHAQIRKSLEYRLWRNLVLKRDNYTCRLCGKRNVRLNADHIKPFADYPELRFDLDNGRTLCVECHIKTPTWGVNQGGRPVIPRVSV